MGSFLYLAAEVQKTAEESGFGFNEILETNLINLGILIALLVVYGRKFIGNILTERKAKIEQEIKDAENRAQTAAADLAEAQKKLASAQAEAEKIRANATSSAAKAKETILADAVLEVKRMKEAAVQELDTEQAKVIAELKQRIATLALQKVEVQLKDRLDGSAQENLIDRSIAQLGGGR